MDSYKVLSIEAWAGQDDFQWEWNNWFNAGSIDLSNIDDDSYILARMAEDGFIKNIDLAAIDDDQFNLVIVNKLTREPIFAIEYGSKIQ